MPKFVYAPEGAEPREWEFLPQRMMNVECEAIERVTGLTFGEAVDAVGRGSMLGLRAFLWCYLRREVPALDFDAVQFCLDDIDLIGDEGEDPKDE